MYATGRTTEATVCPATEPAQSAATFATAYPAYTSNGPTGRTATQPTSAPMRAGRVTAEKLQRLTNL